MRTFLQVAAFVLAVSFGPQLLESPVGLGPFVAALAVAGAGLFGWMVWNDRKTVHAHDVSDAQNLDADRVPELESALVAAGFEPWAVMSTKIGATDRRFVRWRSPDGRTATEVSILGEGPHLALVSVEASGLQRTTGFVATFLPATSRGGRVREVVDTKDPATLLIAHAKFMEGRELLVLDRALVLGLERRAASAVLSASHVLIGAAFASMGGLTAFAMLAGDAMEIRAFLAIIVVSLWIIALPVLFPEQTMSAVLGLTALRLAPPEVSRRAGEGASSRTTPVELPAPAAVAPSAPVAALPSSPRRAVVGILLFLTVLLGGFAAWESSAGG